jgi:hypothetical protein
MAKGTQFFATEETDRLDLGDGYWVELKLGLDYGEESELEGAAIRFGVDTDMVARTATPRVSYSIRDQRILMLALYIVDWSLVNARGRPVALPDQLAARQALFAKLDPKVAAKIIGRIEEIRQADGQPEAISLEGLDPQEGEPALDPTVPGDGTATRSPSSSPNGSAAPTAMSAARRLALSESRSR